MSFAAEVDLVRAHSGQRLFPNGAAFSPVLAADVARTRALNLTGDRRILAEDLRTLRRAQSGLAARAFPAGAGARRDLRYANLPSSAHPGAMAATRFGTSQILSGAAVAVTAATLGPAAGFVIGAGLMAQDGLAALRALPQIGRGARQHQYAAYQGGRGHYDILSAQSGSGHPLNAGGRPKDQIRIARAWQDMNRKQSIVTEMMTRPSMNAFDPNVAPFWKIADMSARDRLAIIENGGRVPLGALVEGGPSARYVVGSHEPRPAQRVALMMGAPAP